MATANPTVRDIPGVGRQTRYECSLEKVAKLARLHKRYGKCMEMTLALALEDDSLWGENEPGDRIRFIVMMIAGFDEASPGRKPHVTPIPGEWKDEILSILNPSVAQPVEALA